MNAEHALPQPDFGRISESLGSLSDQFALCANLPAVDGGAGIMRSLETITNQLTLLNRKVDAMDRRIRHLDMTLIAERRNAVARAQNAVVVRSNMELEPLCSILTGERLANFPGTLGQLERLEAREANSLLEQLGEPVEGRLEDKRRQLKHLAGVVTRQV
ncbi:hypothetical protein HIM_11518 [Hirsutella minnesotensis 3608]|uniref:Uncharacterized protein n=1 Tax=Hirsutella minnesotensis 3608 TaxID=1043627 RepID=A0A0F7ZIZ9_9HYPO|nr:hypothetical protein HIM_11518 [Hirsutella minnesotensis 3608]